MTHPSAKIPVILAITIGALLAVMWMNIRGIIFENRGVSREIMDAIKTRTEKRYTSDDGDKDRAAVDELRRRVEKLEQRK